MKSRTSAPAALILLVGGAAFPASAQETLTLQTIQSNGTNLSYAVPQMIDLSAATNQPLFNADLSALDAQSFDTIRQNASSFTSAGQPVSPQFFPPHSSSLAVNSNVVVIGSLPQSSANYFAFNEPAGATISVSATATFPSGQGAELFLFDNSGNVIDAANGNAADGLSSFIDDTVQNAGTW